MCPHSIGHTQGLSLSPLHSSLSICPFGACLLHAHLQSVPHLPHTTPVLRCEPVRALPSHICCWTSTRELKGPLFLMVALSPAGACHLSHSAVVNGESSWVRALLPNRERGGLSQGWQERDRLLSNQCPVHGHLGLAKVKVGLCKNSGGMFFTPNIQGMG